MNGSDRKPSLMIRYSGCNIKGIWLRGIIIWASGHILWAGGHTVGLLRCYLWVYIPVMHLCGLWAQHFLPHLLLCSLLPSKPTTCLLYNCHYTFLETQTHSFSLFSLFSLEECFFSNKSPFCRPLRGFTVIV